MANIICIHPERCGVQRHVVGTQAARDCVSAHPQPRTQAGIGTPPSAVSAPPRPTRPAGEQDHLSASALFRATEDSDEIADRYAGDILYALQEVAPGRGAEGVQEIDIAESEFPGDDDRLITAREFVEKYGDATPISRTLSNYLRPRLEAHDMIDGSRYENMAEYADANLDEGLIVKGKTPGDIVDSIDLPDALDLDDVGHQHGPWDTCPVCE